MLRPFGISSLLDYQAYGREGGICHFPYCDYVVDQGRADFYEWIDADVLITVTAAAT